MNAQIPKGQANKLAAFSSLKQGPATSQKSLRNWQHFLREIFQTMGGEKHVFDKNDLYSPKNPLEWCPLKSNGWKT